MSMDKPLAVQEIRPKDVNVPARMANAELIEIRITLSPLRWMDACDTYQPDALEPRLRASEKVCAVSHVTRLHIQDSRALFHITREMLHNLMREYLGMKD